MKNFFDIPHASLPNTIPVFPLPGMLLLPGGQVSLNIFEMRYLNMVQDALAAKDRLIGLILPKQDTSTKEQKRPLNTVGCAGRITSFEETLDGRFLITVTGYSRFSLEDELPTVRGYRRFSTYWKPYKDDLNIEVHPDIDRERLISVLKNFAEHSDIHMDWQILENMPSFNLITFFSMSLPFDDIQKQTLLEAKTLANRADLLIEMVESAQDKTHNN